MDSLLEAFWTAYQAGFAPRKIMEDLGYDLEMFGQKQIDSMVQSIKKQALSGNGFRQGEETLNRILNEVKYLRQEVDFLKKIVKTENTAKKKS